MENENKTKTIYDLKFNESLIIYTNPSNGTTQDGLKFTVTRVPGGWIYESVAYASSLSNVFVPYNDEFQSTEWS